MSVAIEQHPFIFSDERKWKIRRHVTFWLVWWLFQGFLYSFIAAGQGVEYFTRLWCSMVESLVFLIPHMFLSYSIVYFIIPRYLLKQQYWKTTGWVMLCCLMTAIISVMLSFTIINYVREVMVGANSYKPNMPSKVVRGFLALMAGFRGAITIGGMAGSIKLMKYWYLKERRNLQLQKQNAEAQLQLLKAQVHPHFLFNTLNNIYSYTQNTAPMAAHLVEGLADMLRYMLYETNQPLVPLQKELQLLENYISLESIRYGNRLDIHTEITGDGGELYIAPLLLIPFLENSFKHGTSNTIENPWISLHIAIGNDNTLQMKLINGKPEQEAPIHGKSKGIGIVNAQKRLQLLYTFQHKLDIINDDDVFIVNLELQLDKKKHGTHRTPEKKTQPAYA